MGENRVNSDEVPSLIVGHRCLVLAFHIMTKRKLIDLVQATLRGRHVCDLSSDCLRNGTHRTEGVILTFDDGIAEMVEIGADVAMEQGWPVIFYLPTEYLDGTGLWQEELTILCRHAQPTLYTVFGRVVDLARPQGRSDVKRAITDEMKRTAPSDLPKLRNEVRYTLDPDGIAPIATEMPRPITWARVRELNQRPEIHFGSHTVTHRPVAVMTRDEIDFELSESKRRIESVIGQEIEHFCYPFGAAKDIGTTAPDLVGKHYRTAVTLVRGFLRQQTDPMLIPRIDLYEKDHPLRVRAKILSTRLGVG